MISSVDRVNKLWDQIEKYYAEKHPDCKLPPGATPADIHELETKIGVNLPDGFKASLLRHNGLEDHWPGGYLNDIEAIIEETKNWLDVEDLDDLVSFVEKNECITHVWWDPKWLFIHADGAGSGYNLDLNPGPKGKFGQVIDFDSHMGASGPLFESFEDYLEDCLSKLGKEDH